MGKIFTETLETKIINNNTIEVKIPSYATDGGQKETISLKEDVGSKEVVLEETKFEKVIEDSVKEVQKTEREINKKISVINEETKNMSLGKLIEENIREINDDMRYRTF